MADMNLIAGEILGILTNIFTLYTTNFILSAVFALWVIKRVARLFDRL